MAFDTPGYRLAWPVALGATLFSAGLFLIVLAMLVRARRRPTSTGDATLLGAEAKVIAWAGEEGEVEALGERWHARAPSRPCRPARTCASVGRDGLTLQVEPE